MPEGAIAGARRQARREDLLALRQLDRVRETAFARGEVRIRQPLASQTDDGSNDGDGQAAEEPIGDEGGRSGLKSPPSSPGGMKSSVRLLPGTALSRNSPRTEL